MTRQDTAGLAGDVVINGTRYPLALDPRTKQLVWIEGDAVNLQGGDPGIPVSAEWPNGVPGGIGETKRISRDSDGCAFATADTSNYGFWRLPPRRVTVTPTIAPTDNPTFGFEQTSSAATAKTISKTSLTSGSATAAASTVAATALTSGFGGGTGSAISATGLTNYTSHSSASSYATSSVTPTANRLVLVAVSSRLANGTPAAPTLTGNSLTYTQVATQTVTVLNWSGVMRVTLFRALSASPSAGAITADFAGVIQAECEIQAIEFAGIDTSGANGAVAVRQSATTSSIAKLNAAVNLSTFGASGNWTGAFFYAASYAGTTTAPLNAVVPMRGIYESTNTVGFGTLLSGYVASNQISISAITDPSTLCNWAGIAVEIVRSPTAGTEYVANAVALSPNKLILVAVLSTKSGGSAGPSGLSGNGCTWVKLTSQQVFGTDHRLTVWRTLNAAPTAGSISMTFAAAQDNCRWSVVEFANVDTTGTNGSGAVVQDAAATSASATSLTVTLGAFGNASNATYGAFGNTDIVGTTPGAGFTELHEVIANNTIQTEWKTANDTSVDASTAATVAWGGVAVEIKFATASTYTTASITPTANRLVLLAVHNNSATADTCTVTGCNLTWSSEATVTISTGRLTVFSALGDAPSAGVVTISFGTNGQTAVRWSIVEFAGTADNSADAVLQPTTASNASATSLTVTLAAFAALTNATFGAFATADTAGMSPGTGFTELDDVAANSFELQTEWLNATDTTVDSSKTGAAAAYLGIALEIQAGTQINPFGGTSCYYIGQGEYVTKLTVAANAITVQEQTHLGDGATVGHPTKFGSDTFGPHWFVPAGPYQPYRLLTDVTATTGDTWVSEPQGYKARGFATTNQGVNTVLVRAHSGYLVNISTDGTTWAASNFAIGDASASITSIEDSGTTLFVAKEDNLYEFDSAGITRQLTRYPKGDKAATYGAGLMVPTGSSAAFYNHKSLHLYRNSEAVMVGPDAIRTNKSIPNISYEPIRGTHYETVYASDEWVYAVYRVVESSITKTYILAGQKTRTGYIWHSFDRFDGVAHLALVDSSKRLWFTFGTVIGYWQIGPDGSPDAGRDAIGYGQPSTTYTVTYPREDFGFPHTMKQLRAIEVKAWYPTDIASSPIQMQVYRDGRVAETVGATIFKGMSANSAYPVSKRYWGAVDSGTTVLTDVGTSSIVYSGSDVFATGDTLLIGDERVLVSTVNTGTDTLSVSRAMHGTKLKVHDAGTIIYFVNDLCLDAQIEASVTTTGGYDNTVTDGNEFRVMSVYFHAFLRPDGARKIKFQVDTRKDYANGAKPPDEGKDMHGTLRNLERGAPVAFTDPDGNTGNLYVTNVSSSVVEQGQHYLIDVDAIKWVNS